MASHPEKVFASFLNYTIPTSEGPASTTPTTIKSVLSDQSHSQSLQTRPIMLCNIDFSNNHDSKLSSNNWFTLRWGLEGQVHRYLDYDSSD